MKRTQKRHASDAEALYYLYVLLCIRGVAHGERGDAVSWNATELRGRLVRIPRRAADVVRHEHEVSTAGSAQNGQLTGATQASDNVSDGEMACCCQPAKVSTAPTPRLATAADRVVAGGAGTDHGGARDVAGRFTRRPLR